MTAIPKSFTHVASAQQVLRKREGGYYHVLFAPHKAIYDDNTRVHSGDCHRQAKGVAGLGALGCWQPGQVGLG